MIKKFIFLSVLILQISLVLAIQPSGANVTEVSSSRATPDAPTAHAAIAGNVTEINIVGNSITQTWQGYFGNVSGTIQLADGSGNAMYNWSLASPQGEIYASISSTVSWTNLQCLNFTSDGTKADDSAQVGDTSLHGTNLTQLEESFNISSDDVDGVDETFNLLGAGTHDLFYANNLQFDEGECRSTRLFSNAGVGENDKFEEVLLYDPDGQNVVFTSLLDEDVLGFDNASHDFEILVLEDGHGTDTSTTTYYFYVELE